jgi:hypothetical protein
MYAMGYMVVKCPRPHASADGADGGASRVRDHAIASRARITRGFVYVASSSDPSISQQRLAYGVNARPGSRTGVEAECTWRCVVPLGKMHGSAQ